MSRRIDGYVLHAERHGDPRSVFEAASSDDFTASELVYLAGRLRRLPAREYEAGRNGHRVIRKRWPRFSLTEKEKEQLVRALVKDGFSTGEIVRRLRTTKEYAAAAAADIEAEALCRKLANGPVDLLDAHLPAERYQLWMQILGHGSNTASNGNGRPYVEPKIAAGFRVGRLEVLRPDDDRTRHWICRCDCAGEISVRRDKLISASTKSCGCLRREQAERMRKPA